MTSLPIMWYACFDFEKKRDRRMKANAYKEELKEELLVKDKGVEMSNMSEHLTAEEKEQYLKNPDLYGIGLRRECFSKTLFMQWIFYALWHAVLIFFFVLYVLNQ